MILAFTCAALPAAAQEDDALYFLMTPDTVACLKAHAVDYAPEADGTAFITVADCGSEDAASETMELMAQVQNSAPDIAVSAQDAPDAVVALGAADFACLAGLDVPEGAALLAWYPERCDVEVRQ